MKYLLVGGSGFIGLHFFEKLKKDSIINIDIDGGIKDLNHINCDITSVNELNTIDISKHNDVTLIHLAAVHFDFQKGFFKTNVDGTKNILSFIKKNKNITHFVFFSSVATYGNSKDGKGENDKQSPINDYGRSKLEAEQEIKLWHQKNQNVKTIIVRPAVVFGEYNFGNVYNLICQIKSGFFATIGKGQNIKSIAYAGNLVDSVFFALKKVEKGRMFIYNYSDYPQMCITDQVHLIGELLNRRVRFKIPYKVVKAITTPIDIFEKIFKVDLIINSMRVEKFISPTYFKSDLIRDLGFTPSVKIEGAIGKTVNWIKTNDTKTLRARWFKIASNL